MKKLFLLFIAFLPLSTFAQKSTLEWTVVATYEIPGKAGGLTYDGSFLYSGLYSSPGDDNLIYKIDPSDGSYELQCIAPQDKSYGLSFDGTNFWSTDRQGSYDPALAVQFDPDGALLSSFELPATYVSGIEYMADGSFWVCAYYDPDGVAFHVDAAGNILGQFNTPNNQPWAICQMNENFWIADYDADMLYLVDGTGQTIESHGSIDVSPSGIVYDGQYLWYVAGPSQNNSTLYQIDLGCGGNPVLDIQPHDLNMAAVLVGENIDWPLSFTNTGGSTGVFDRGNLTGIGANHINLNNLPDQITVEANETTNITADINLLSPGNIDIIQKFTTNDPLNDEIQLHIYGDVTYDGAVLQIVETELNYTDIRKNASTRRYLHLVNAGNSSLTVNEINYGDNSFYTDESIELPIDIASLDTLTMGVWFFPHSSDSHNTSLSVFSNDPNSPDITNLNANAIDANEEMGALLWDFQITEGTDQSPKAMLSIEDVSGDGRGDLIVCSENDIIRCLNGNSSGTADELWQTSIYSGNVFQQNAISPFIDADGDSFDDFVIGTTGADRSVICLSSKTGENIWKYHTNEYGDGGWVYQVYGDKNFNDDGIHDVLAAVGNDSYNTGPKCVFLIDGSNGQKIWRTPLNGPGFAVIGVEDFTGDGKVDVIAGASNGDESEGRIFGIDGSNGQIVWSQDSQGSSVWGLQQLGDINNDGIADVMAGDFNGYYYFIDAENGNILHQQTIGNNIILRLLKLDDINEDGFNDILIASSSTQAYLIDGYSSNVIWNKPISDKAWDMVAANDLNADGLADVMVGTLYQNNYSYFLDGSNGQELSKKQAATAIDALASIADVCGDYTMEMVVGDRNGYLSCYSGGPNGTVGIAPPPSSKQQQTFKISPNPIPSSYQIHINWSENERVKQELVSNASGQKWKLENLYLTKGKQQIESHFPPSLKKLLSSGLYQVKISGSKDSQQAKIIYLKK